MALAGLRYQDSLFLLSLPHFARVYFIIFLIVREIILLTKTHCDSLGKEIYCNEIIVVEFVT